MWLIFRCNIFQNYAPRSASQVKAAPAAIEMELQLFADVVINVLLSSDQEVDSLLDVLSKDRGGFKCVYLTGNGCLWHMKPIVCEMFLCKYAKDAVFENNDVLRTQWKKFCRRERQYTWPSRPVLFDKLEEVFIRGDGPLPPVP